MSCEFEHVCLCTNLFVFKCSCVLCFIAQYVSVCVPCGYICMLLQTNSFFGTAECQQIHYPLAELLGAEIEKSKREREMRSGSADGWSDGRMNGWMDASVL